MMDTIGRNIFENQLLTLLNESFDDVKGIYLDDHTSLFETLGSIDAPTASRPAVESGSTIAGHVEHLRWYIEITEGFIAGEEYKGFGWKKTWRVTTVTNDEWAALVESLRAACDRVLALVRGYEDWNDEKRLGGMMAIVAHTAYHLGAIRQMVRVAAS